MDSAVVHNLNLNHVAAAGLEDAAYAVSEQNVAHVPKVQRLVGVGTAEFHHGGGSVRINGRGAPSIRAADGVKASLYLVGTQYDVQKTLNRVVANDQGRCRKKRRSDLVGGVHGRFAAELEEGKNH